MSRISVKDAVKRYGNNTVIPDLDLEIGDGELFTLLGPCLLYTSDAADE